MFVEPAAGQSDDSLSGTYSGTVTRQDTRDWDDNPGERFVFDDESIALACTGTTCSAVPSPDDLWRNEFILGMTFTSTGGGNFAISGSWNPIFGSA